MRAYTPVAINLIREFYNHPIFADWIIPVNNAASLCETYTTLMCKCLDTVGNKTSENALIEPYPFTLYQVFKDTFVIIIII